MPKTNAENCRAYYYRNKYKRLKNNCSTQTNAELSRAYRLQEKVGESFMNVILCPANSSSQATHDPSLSSTECENIKDVKPKSCDKCNKNTETDTRDDRKDKKSKVKPLLPVNFLKSHKKNLLQMTREELEEFCILKIAESIVDRTNLIEMNSQLKSMARNIEYCKKRTYSLIKQNRILKVVLKSVEEEYKNSFEETITPLKITRSVGIQVLMEETPKRIKLMTSNKSHNIQNENREYPVPDFVPAVINSNTKNKVPTLNPSSNSPTTHSPKTANNVRNGSKETTSKPIKKSYSMMKEGNSITDDITDDETPVKVIRNIAPVRLIPQKSLVTTDCPPIPQIVNPLNTPGILYVPIGSQNQVGQTFVLNQVCPPAQRPLEPTLLAKPITSISMPIIAAKAPLPESVKPCQPAKSQRPREPTLLPKPTTSISKPIIAAKQPAPLPESAKPFQPPNSQRPREPTLLPKPTTSISKPIIAAKQQAPLPESVIKYQPPNSQTPREPTLLPKPTTSISRPIIAAKQPSPLPESVESYQPPNAQTPPETLLAKPITSISSPIIGTKHPAPLPESVKPYQPPNCKALPPRPILELSKVENGIVITWIVNGYKDKKYEEIASYQLYAYQETSAPPTSALWEKIGDVKALALPIACTLTQFEAGYKYHFAVRAIDVRSRIGPFSLPGEILLLDKI